MRSRINWYEAGEKPTKYFLNSEKQNYNRKWIKRLKIGKEIVNTKEGILREQECFCKDLYTANYRQAQEMYLNDLDLLTLSREDIQYPDRIIDLEELEIVIKQLKSNKAPGTDGLPIEFYHTFWAEIRINLYYLFQC